MKAEIRTKPQNTEKSASYCIYVQRFIRTKHAMTFKLSDGSIQTNFFDHTKLVTHQKENFFVFISSKGDSKYFPLDTFDSKDKLVTSRIRYVRDTIGMMVRIKHHILPSRSSPTKFKNSPRAKRQKIC